MFFRWRVAWIICLFGTGASACLWGYTLLMGVAEWFGEQKGFDIFMLAAMSMVALILVVPFSATFGLFIGLVRKRNELI